MKNEKKAINYYSSFFEVSKDLNQKQFYDFNMAIFKVMFFEEHIENISFQDLLLKTLWKSVKHSIWSSVKGYCDKKNIPYEDMFCTPCQPPYVPPCQEEQEKEQEKGKAFSFSLNRESSYENLSLEYKEKLKNEIDTLGLNLSFIDFVDSLVAKGYKYKNFLSAYKNWSKKDNGNKYQKRQIQGYRNEDILI